MVSRYRVLATLMLAAALMTSTLLAAKKNKPASKLKFDPTAEKVDMFAGMESKQLDVKMIPKNALGGTLLIENKTKKPLTVKIPEAFVGVHVLKQGGAGIGGGGLAQGGGGFGGGGGGGGQSQGGGGGQQGGFGGGGQQGGGGGFFSIPPEQIAKIPYKAVCLEYGKPDPKPRMSYRPYPLDKFTQDPMIRELVKMIGTGRLDPQSAQAAAWHLTDKMSWQKLASIGTRKLGTRAARPLFQPAQLRRAQQLVAMAKKRVEERKDAPKDKDEDKPSRTERRSRVAR